MQTERFFYSILNNYAARENKPFKTKWRLELMRESELIESKMDCVKTVCGTSAFETLGLPLGSFVAVVQGSGTMTLKCKVPKRIFVS